MAWTWNVTEAGLGEVFGTFNAVLSNSSGLPLEVDKNTRALATIDYAHHAIHRGDHFFFGGWVGAMTGTTVNFKMQTPDLLKWNHFIYDITSSGICEIKLWEGASDGMLGGTSILPINNNRNVVGTSPFLVTVGVTAPSSYGTKIDSAKWGASGVKIRLGGGASRDDEIILKQNTIYLGQMISGADDNIIQFRTSWYEHTNKT